jgi:hypothetical protein
MDNEPKWWEETDEETHDGFSLEQSMLSFAKDIANVDLCARSITTLTAPGCREWTRFIRAFAEAESRSRHKRRQRMEPDDSPQEMLRGLCAEHVLRSALSAWRESAGAEIVTQPAGDVLQFNSCCGRFGPLGNVVIYRNRKDAEKNEPGTELHEIDAIGRHKNHMLLFDGCTSLSLVKSKKAKKDLEYLHGDRKRIAGEDADTVHKIHVIFDRDNDITCEPLCADGRHVPNAHVLILPGRKYVLRLFAILCNVMESNFQYRKLLEVLQHS